MAITKMTLPEKIGLGTTITGVVAITASAIAFVFEGGNLPTNITDTSNFIYGGLAFGSAAAVIGIVIPVICSDIKPTMNKIAQAFKAIPRMITNGFRNTFKRSVSNVCGSKKRNKLMLWAVPQMVGTVVTAYGVVSCSPSSRP